jgi:hypothetical protein
MKKAARVPWLSRDALLARRSSRRSFWDKLIADGRECLGGVLQLFLSVDGRHPCADACPILWNHRVRKANGINTLAQQTFGKAGGQPRVLEDDGNDRMLVRRDLGTQFGQPVPKGARIRPQTLSRPGILIQSALRRLDPERQ